MELLLKLSKDTLEKGKSIRFQAKGWSMRPFIRDGDFIVVSPVKSSSIRKGDVLIKADASFGFPPEKVDIQNVLGKAIAIERNGREKRLDRKLYQIIGLFFAMISPFSRWIYPIGSILKQSGRRILGVF
jgi:signal peptidase I